MAHFRTVDTVRLAATGIERDLTKIDQRKATQVLQHAQRIERNRQVSLKRAKARRRVDWNVAVFSTAYPFNYKAS
jgi:hypothetical protein